LDAYCYLLLFIMIRRSLCSSLFPYTTLFRSVLVFFAATFVLFAHEKVGRSVALPFVIVAATGAASVRILKDFLAKHYDVKSKTTDRKSTRLNSSHQIISYAVFCLKKKTS